jgi:hypothetical protein
MLRKGLVAVAAAALMVTAFSGFPADARAKKNSQSRADTRYRAETPSLDGRITGRSRTCWHETFVYDGLGVPVGPYCH